MGSRRAKVTGVALGLLAALGGGIYGYRSYALRKKAQGPTATSTPTATPEGTPAEREARLLAGLDAAPSAPDAAAWPLPGTPAAREAELLRRVGDGLLPAAARPLVALRAKGEPLSPASLALAESIAHDRAMAEERRAREAAWPAIQEAEPPPGPTAAVRPPPPKPRPPRLELPARLDQWGE